MTEQGRKFVIAGAGIAGLTMALALAKFGASVTVIERRDTIGEFGAGLQISSNARRILERLGAGRFLLPRMHVPPAIDVYPFRRKKPIVSLELGKVVQERFGAPYGVIHRGDLVEALHQACKRFATIDILFGVRKVDFAHHARGFSVMVEEADGKSRTIRPFAYIGADGVHSATRTDLMEGPPARYTGYTAWRKLVDFADMPEGLHKANTSLLWGPEFHAVVYPLPPHKAANVVMFTRLSEKRAKLVRDGKRDFRAPREMRHSEMFTGLLRAGGEMTPWPLYGVSTKVWHKDVIGLIGDAAHAMLPFQAQGAAMGIEDAAILAPLLIAHEDPQTAFEAYARLRQKRVGRVSSLSTRNGGVFHLPWPFAYARDAVVFLQGPRAHLKRLAWIYSYDPAPDPETEMIQPGQEA